MPDIEKMGSTYKDEKIEISACGWNNKDIYTIRRFITGCVDRILPGDEYVPIDHCEGDPVSFVNLHTIDLQMGVLGHFQDTYFISHYWKFRDHLKYRKSTRCVSSDILIGEFDGSLSQYKLTSNLVGSPLVSFTHVDKPSDSIELKFIDILDDNTLTTVERRIYERINAVLKLIILKACTPAEKASIKIEEKEFDDEISNDKYKAIEYSIILPREEFFRELNNHGIVRVFSDLDRETINKEFRKISPIIGFTMYDHKNPVLKVGSHYLVIVEPLNNQKSMRFNATFYSTYCGGLIFRIKSNEDNDTCIKGIDTYLDIELDLRYNKIYFKELEPYESYPEEFNNSDLIWR